MLLWSEAVVWPLMIGWLTPTSIGGGLLEMEEGDPTDWASIEKVWGVAPGDSVPRCLLVARLCRY